MKILVKILVVAGIAAIIGLFSLPKTSLALAMPQVLGLSTSCPVSMDLNNDGIINSLDLSVVLGHIGQNYPPAEFDNATVVDNQDATMLFECWFATH